MGKHAIVFGASGIQGWAFVNELLCGEDTNEFSNITALTNRALPPEYTLWPESSRLRLVPGLDLVNNSREELEDQFKKKVPDVESITHVYFCAYKWIANQAEEVRVNTRMLEYAIGIIDSLSPALQFVALPTGTKTYGMHLLKDGFPFKDRLPLSEDLPKLPEPQARLLLYSSQVAMITKLADSKKWTWCEVRPDLIIGFVPNNNPHCLPQILGIYLSLYAHVEGPGSKVPFPGSMGAFTAKFVPASQDIIAKFCIFASLRPDLAGRGSAFNIGDRAEPTSWSSIWPIICSIFGLEGIEPRQNTLPTSVYIEKHRQHWNRIVEERHLRSGFVDNKLANPAIFSFMTGLMDFDRQCSLAKARSIGFTVEIDEKDAWSTVFQRFRDARVIPCNRAPDI